MSLKSIIDDLTVTERSVSGEIPSGWTQGRTVYGGMTAALSLMAAQQLADGRPLRSAFIGFVGPSSGTLTVEADLVRSGRNTSSIRSHLSSDLGPGVEALFTFSGNRESTVSHEGPSAPLPPPDPSAIALEFPEGAPAFTRNMEFVWACNSIPYGGSAESLMRAWVRHRDPESREHPLALMCLADALPPAVAATLTGYAPLSSMTWMVDFLDDEPTTTDGWWLLESRTDFAAGGHATQDMTIWNTDGRCVVKGRQMVTVFA